MRARYWWPVLAFMLSLVLVPQLNAQETAPAWSEPLMLSENRRSHWFPAIASSSERVHVVWGTADVSISGVEVPVDLLAYRELHNGVWSGQNEIIYTGTGGFVPRASLSSDGRGLIHLLVRNQLAVAHYAAPVEQANAASSWTQPRRINNLNTPYYSALAIDSKGTLHAIWNETALNSVEGIRADCLRCSEIFYRRSNDGGETWSSPVNLSNMPLGSTKPEIMIDSAGRIHVAWDEGRDAGLSGRGRQSAVAHRMSSDGGLTWSPTNLFLLSNDSPHQVAIAADAQANPLIVFRGTSTDRVFWTRSTDGGVSWSQPQAFDNIIARPMNDTPFDGYSLVSDSNGKIYFALAGYLPEDFDLTGPTRTPRLMVLRWDGNAWNAPETVVANELLPEWPQMTVQNGNQLHLVWFTRSLDDIYDSDNGQYRVWYSGRTLDAPAQIAPTLPPLPTATALPEPTPFPQPSPIPTLGSQALAAPIVADRPAWERPGTVRVGIALLPVMLVFGAISGLLVLRRKRQ